MGSCPPAIAHAGALCRATVANMTTGARFLGLSILVVEDEPLIAMDIAQAFEPTGAEIIITYTLEQALARVEQGALSAAILDHALGNANSLVLYAGLTARGIPFMIYSGFGMRPDGVSETVPIVRKPASEEELVAAMNGLIAGAPARSGN